jgi:hypothetical protein
MRYHLFKRTRVYGGQPYCGPTSGGISAEYGTLEAAQQAAYSFTIRNPVGWDIYDSETGILVTDKIQTLEDCSLTAQEVEELRDDPLSLLLPDYEMCVKDIEWSETTFADLEDTLYAVNLPDVGRITVLNRLTGYSGRIFDTETGYRTESDKFWLASGMFDIRSYPDLTIAEAVALIKERANTCIGD